MQSVIKIRDCRCRFCQYRGVAVLVSVRVDDREDVPLEGPGHLGHSGVLAAEELLHDVGGGGRGDPLAGVYPCMCMHSGHHYILLGHPTSKALYGGKAGRTGPRPGPSQSRALNSPPSM